MTRAVVLLVLAWSGVGAGALGLGVERPAVPQIGRCEAPVTLLESGAEVLACLDGAPDGTRPGRRYERVGDGWVDRGPMRGALLAMHGLPVPVNEASEEDLRALPGVGPSLARRIREARDARPYCRSGDLDRVPGLGPVKVRAIAGAATFEHPRCRADSDR